LNKDPEKRLGSKRGFSEIKEHPFFADMDIESILNNKVTNYLFK
jgi:hypothetical protein